MKNSLISIGENLTSFGGLVLKNVKTAASIKLRMLPLVLIAQRAVARTARQYVSGPRPNRLGPVTGHLRRSIKTPLPRITISGVEADVVVESPYGRIHEEGGTIKPLRGNFLTIPLKKGLAPLDHISGTFLIPSRSGGYVAARKESGGELEPLYALVKEVEMPARPYLAPAVRDNSALITALYTTGYVESIRQAMK